MKRGRLAGLASELIVKEVGRGMVNLDLVAVMDVSLSSTLRRTSSFGGCESGGKPIHRKKTGVNLLINLVVGRIQRKAGCGRDPRSVGEKYSYFHDPQPGN